MERNELDHAIEIAPNVWWIGYNTDVIWARTNPYLIVEANEAVLIDPGSMVDFEIVKRKVEDVIPITNLKYIVLHHQDPDLCGSTSAFEKLTTLFVVTTTRAALFCRHYGISSFSETIDGDNQTITFKTGRKLRFFLTPYCHSPMAMVTYDEQNKILFSSDIFSAFNIVWRLYADMLDQQQYLDDVKRFMEPYMASNEAVMNFISKVEPLEINMICPQHGSIIRKNIDWWFDQLKTMKYGKAITEGKTGIELPHDLFS